MVDSVTPAAVPKGVPVVAGYVDGSYGPLDPYRSGWNANSWSQFPGSQMVTITVTGLPGARVYDIEPGGGTPAQGASWAKQEIQGGRRPTLYFSEYLWPTIFNSLASVGVPRAAVDYWIAKYDRVASIPAAWLAQGCVAKQYLNNQRGVQGSYIDYSVTNNVWPGAPHAPIIPPPVVPTPPPVVTSYPESNVTAHEMTLPAALDGSGNGYFSAAGLGIVNASAIVSITWITEPPASVGRYDKLPSNWAIDANSELVITGGSPNARYGCIIWTAD